MKRFSILAFLYFFVTIFLYSQSNTIPIGTWQSHFDYTKGNAFAKAGNKIYFAAVNGFFVYDIAQNETNLLTENEGFSELTINKLAYHSITSSLIIAYNSGKIDIVKLDSDNEILEIKTILSIKNSSAILGSKKTNDILISNNICYLSTDFGIVHIDLIKKQINEIDQNLGENGIELAINSIIISGGKILAISNLTLISAVLSASTNLQNFASWQHYNLPINAINANNKLLNFENSIYCIIDEKVFEIIDEKFHFIINLQEPIMAVFVNKSNILFAIKNGLIQFETKFSNKKTISNNLIKSTNQILVESGKLWLSDTQNGFISDITGSFKSYNPSKTQGLQNIRNDSIVTDKLAIIWTRLPKGSGLQIADKTGKKKIFQRIPLADNDNRFQSSTVNSIAIDKNNFVFVATDAGIVAINSTMELFEKQNLETSITTPRIDGKRVLQNEEVLSISIDGGNRKWIGTSSGLFLFNESLDKELIKFTIVNSPLPSNRIEFLNMEQSTGELYIHTQNGIVSYRSDATESADYQDNNVIIFPNPVKPEFDGLVGISGLVANAFVKIIDISGRLVYQTRANGGTAIWNLNTYNGKRAETGIYYILSGNEIGMETLVSKLAIIK